MQQHDVASSGQQLNVGVPVHIEEEAKEDSVPRELSPIANSLVKAFEYDHTAPVDEKIKVNPLISRVATWYEKFRNAMDYREEEVVLRAAIERILKRRILFGGTGKTIASPLIRELAWARYFKEDSLSESSIETVSQKIDLYLGLRENLLSVEVLSESNINEWIYHLLSSDIEHMLNKQREKEMIGAFMFEIIKDHIQIAEMDEQTKNVQVFIAIRRAFAKDDIAFLRFHLFSQFFDTVTSKNLEKISSSFFSIYSEIQKQLNHPKKEAIFGYIKSKTAVFLILEDITRFSTGKVREVLTNEKELERVVMEACESRYASISSKVRRAIIRSVIFLLLTKAFFAFAVEGTFENYFYGSVLWSSMIVNITIPPLLMIIVGLFIKVPRKANSKRILEYIKKVLFEENPGLGDPFVIKKSSDKNKNMDIVFRFLWFFAFFVTFGAIVWVLQKVHFNFISKGVFIFFLAIVSFLSYRIGLMSKVYTVEERQGWNTPIVDFFFMPIIRVGRHLTDGIAQINILIFIFDFIIETPFKGIFAFFEQLFLFLHAKREGLE
ncbi:MAG: hypothetical protein A3F31_00225 [Candidatus Levybacteria bacterium RIFCSPHIGHO2_12_FULL_38_12]|nr:MAG: hypothetical protein A2770_03290 [Candidatus Levybacteria bacterium RIFCSPHIGHO2_01_FULL_38_12]OGH23187.1 MAG: hypothetical protein A3F31_00225 [Candidatus Levybacteria bacterium RIFCSPHIGHO2_12_FULL_38_12]OGH34465.1 MAG: hypothetical protein A3A47_00745 [Candidatus Levybacteria bacterium RIFCSPLOWO2_01_FULL_37_20]OGH44713.1 MAG: hypothetical protein A3J14_00105 [Candidatus Levybacteria bacterium RIFCSPLOWO2_02_FULL_37_18]